MIELVIPAYGSCTYSVTENWYVWIRSNDVLVKQKCIDNEHPWLPRMAHYKLIICSVCFANGALWNAESCSQEFHQARRCFLLCSLLSLAENLSYTCLHSVIDKFTRCSYFSFTFEPFYTTDANHCNRYHFKVLMFYYYNA